MKRQHILILIMIAILKALLAFTNHTSEANTKVDGRNSSLHSSLYAADPNRFRVSADTLSLQEIRK
ncbi:hypothetical protein WJR50_15545 [Catalinimonas sp. 4WD22]|uniref:hypothetical protein n=1 Tax=Catalinimonas locisalis TaxID=3133978 RepID=UPI0031015F1D